MISNEMMQEVLGAEMSAEALEMAQILYAAIPTNWALEDFAAAWKAGEKSRNRRENGDDKAARQEERERARANRANAVAERFAKKAAKEAAKEAERLRKIADKEAARIEKIARRLEIRLEKDDLNVWGADGERVDVTAYTHPELVSMALTVRAAGYVVCFPVGDTTYNIQWLHKVRAQAGVTVPEYVGFEVGDL